MKKQPRKNGVFCNVTDDQLDWVKKQQRKLKVKSGIENIPRSTVIYNALIAYGMPPKQ